MIKWQNRKRNFGSVEKARDPRSGWGGGLGAFNGGGFEWEGGLGIARSRVWVESWRAWLGRWKGLETSPLFGCRGLGWLGVRSRAWGWLMGLVCGARVKGIAALGRLGKWIGEW